MNFEGIRLVDKSKLVRILHAVELAELASLYGALHNTDENLRNSFCIFLAQNPVRGGDIALAKLSETLDPLIAVRAAAVCLLAIRIAGQEN